MNVRKTPRTDAKAMGFRRQTVGAVETAISWAETLEQEFVEMTADRDSWRQQHDDRVVDLAKQLDLADALRAELHGEFIDD